MADSATKVNRNISRNIFFWCGCLSHRISLI